MANTLCSTCYIVSEYVAVFKDENICNEEKLDAHTRTTRRMIGSPIVWKLEGPEGG